MSDQRETGRDPGALWRNQPEESKEVELEQILPSRTRELHSATLSETLVSMGAALFFVAVTIWRVGAVRDGLLWAGVALVLAWMLITVYRSRTRLAPRRPSPDNAALSSVEYYRRELISRRDHLRNEWVWHGPLFLACVVFGLAIRKGFPVYQRFWAIMPLLVALALWAVWGSVRRRRQAAELQREIDEIDRDRME